MSAEPAGPPDFLFLLHNLARMLRTEADRRARAHGATRAQWASLFWLQRQPGLSQKELAALLEVEPITVARMIDRLQARGLVERRADPHDRRVWRLYLTDAALPTLAELDTERRAILAEATVGIAPGDLAIATDVLQRMRAAFGGGCPPQASPVPAPGGVGAKITETV
jgi:MarR family transcriptional regulator for hemolysin